MLTRFEVQNFRGFEHLAVESLARVNLIAGKNNVGKTALLEAIFLHLGWHNPLLPLRVNSLRGVEWLSTQPGEAWGWLFYDRKLTSTIVLRSQDERGQTQNVEIALNWRGSDDRCGKYVERPIQRLSDDNWGRPASC